MIDTTKIIYISSVKIQIFKTPNRTVGQKHNVIDKAQSWTFCTELPDSTEYDIVRKALAWAFTELSVRGVPEEDIWVKIVLPGNYRSFQYKNMFEVARLDVFTAPIYRVENDFNQRGL